MAVVVGIDVGIATDHRAVVFKNGKRVSRPFAVRPDRGGLDALVSRARAVADADEEVTAVVDPTGFAWTLLTAELQRQKVVVTLPNARLVMAKRTRAEAKTDASDAERLASYALVQPHNLNTQQPSDPHRTMAKLVLRARHGLVGEAVRLNGRILALLPLANPTLIRCLTRGLTRVERAVLREKLDPSAVVAEGQQAFRAFCLREVHGTLSESWFADVWHAYESAAGLLAPLRAANQLPVDLTALQWVVADFVVQLDAVQARIRAYDQQLSALYLAMDPGRMLETQVPGVGPLIGVALEAHLGDVTRFRNIKAFARFCGITPGTHRSGKTNRVGLPITKAAANDLKQLLFLAAEAARQADPTLAALYHAHLGVHHAKAVIVVAHALVRRIWALLQARQAFNAAKPGAKAPAYQFRTPEGSVLTRVDARAYVQTHYPSGEARRRRDGTARKASPPPDAATAASPTQPPPVTSTVQVTTPAVPTCAPPVVARVGSPGERSSTALDNGVAARTPPTRGPQPVSRLLQRAPVGKLWNRCVQPVGSSRAKATEKEPHDP